LHQEHQPQTIRVLTFNILSSDHASPERRLQPALGSRRCDLTSSRYKRRCLGMPKIK
jgi:hypothetical protein